MTAIEDAVRRAIIDPASVIPRADGEDDDAWRTRAVLHAVRPLRPAPGDPLIGERLCSNCRSALFEHCHVHLIPCCPGKCPGRRPERPRHRKPWQV